jgi:hypothetical protein
MGLSLAVMSLQQPSGEMGGAMGMLLHQNSGFFHPRRAISQINQPPHLEQYLNF